jgi:hypothetical protein
VTHCGYSHGSGIGEFQGEDAASPVTARIAYQHHRTGLVSLRDADAFRFDPASAPLETRVEREVVPLTLRLQTDGQEFSDVLFAVRWGKRLLQMMKDAGIGGDYTLYRDKFPIRVLEQDAEAESIGLSAARRVADGVAIWRSVTLGTHDAWLDTTASVSKAALKILVKSFADACSKSVNRLFMQPTSAEDSAWISDHLEYQFAVGAQPAEREVVPTLRADQYYQGHLDWYSFDAYMDRPHIFP